MSQFFCSICHETFNASQNRPCTISCGHSFCYSCLKNDYVKNHFITCQDCHKKETLHFSKIPTNYAVFDLLIKHIEGPIPVSKADYNLITKISREISFTIKKLKVKPKIEKKEQKTVEYISLYNYFEFMKYLIRYTDTNKKNLIGKIFTFIYKPVIFCLLILLNVFIFKNYEFGLVYLFICVIYENGNSFHTISKKVKMWMGFVSFVLFENLMWKLGIVIFENISFVQNIFSCIRTVYIILLLGNEITLNAIITKILNVMYYTNLILK